MQLLYDVMKQGGQVSKYQTATAIAAKALIACGEGMRKPSKREAEVATEVLAKVVEFIEVTQLRGGAKAHMQTKEAIYAYAMWKGLQGRAGKVLLKFHNPKKGAIPQFDDTDLDI
jgi:hypothetical protein